MEKGRPPLRLRHSWEARYRLVGLVLAGQSPQAASVACGMSRSTAYRLLGRYQQGGWLALQDRPPVAKRCPHRLSVEAEAQIVALRQQTGWGPRALSAALGRPPSTIWRVLKRHGCSRALRQPRPAANRYEYAAVGELVHLDIKKLGRFWRIGKRILNDGVRYNSGAGWQYAHVAIDDHSRLAQVELRTTERGTDCVAFTRQVIHTYAQQGTPIQRILTDNGAGYRSDAFADLLAQHHIRHIRTRPYTPRTNGKAKPSSASCNANGPTPSSTPQAATAPEHSQAGSAGTTTTDHTAASAATHPSPASHTLRGPTSSAGGRGRFGTRRSRPGRGRGRRSCRRGG
jgi:transposase InsO family protein